MVRPSLTRFRPEVRHSFTPRVLCSWVLYRRPRVANIHETFLKVSTAELQVVVVVLAAKS